MMKTIQKEPRDIDDYIAGFPEDVQVILQKIRATIRKAAPQAEETIRYKMPTFNLNDRYLIYFAAYKRHIGMYPIPAGDKDFQEKLSTYHTGKGTLRFPLDKPIPYMLIAKIVKLRVQENLTRVAKHKSR